MRGKLHSTLVNSPGKNECANLVVFKFPGSLFTALWIERCVTKHGVMALETLDGSMSCCLLKKLDGGIRLVIEEVEVHW